MDFLHGVFATDLFGADFLHGLLCCFLNGIFAEF